MEKEKISIIIENIQDAVIVDERRLRYHESDLETFKNDLTILKANINDKENSIAQLKERIKLEKEILKEYENGNNDTKG